jgi:hypothetical protein
MQVGHLIDVLQEFRGRGDDVKLRICTESGFYDDPSKFESATKNIGVRFDGQYVVIQADK